MRTFAQCVDANMEMPGYCHGPLTDAKQLANHQVCTNGNNRNIGFHSPSLPIQSLRPACRR